MEVEVEFSPPSVPIHPNNNSTVSYHHCGMDFDVSGEGEETQYEHHNHNHGDEECTCFLPYEYTHGELENANILHNSSGGFFGNNKRRRPGSHQYKSVDNTTSFLGKEANVMVPCSEGEEEEEEDEDEENFSQHSYASYSTTTTTNISSSSSSSSSSSWTPSHSCSDGNERMEQDVVVSSDGGPGIFARKKRHVVRVPENKKTMWSKRTAIAMAEDLAIVKTIDNAEDLYVFFADGENPCILKAGVTKLVDCLQLNRAFLYLLAYHWRCKQYLCISYEEWMDGMEMWKCHSLNDLRSQLVHQIPSLWKDRWLLNDVFTDSFAFINSYRTRPEEQYIDVDAAADCIASLLEGRPFTKDALKYWKSNPQIHCVSCQFWTNFFKLNFMKMKEVSNMCLDPTSVIADAGEEMVDFLHFLGEHNQILFPKMPQALFKK